LTLAYFLLSIHL